MLRPTIHYDMLKDFAPHAIDLVARIAEDVSPDGDLIVDPHHLEDPTFRSLTSGMVRFRQSGRQVFCVGPELQDMFRRTSLARIPLGHLCMPYRGFYVATPGCSWELWGGVRTRWHRLSGVYVWETNSSEPRGVHMFFWAEANERSVHPADDASFWLTLGLDECIDNGVDLDTYVETLLSMPERDNSSSITGWTPEVNEKVHQTAKDVTRLVFNLLLYLRSDQPDLEKKEKRNRARDRLQKKLKKLSPEGPSARRVRRQLDDLPAETVTYIAPTIEREMSEWQEGGMGGVRHHYVRGHGRWVPYGPRDATKYRFRYIKPYKRGDESLGTIEGRNYQVQGPDDGD